MQINELNPLLAGFLLDTLIGDPHGMPHPIRWFGTTIAFLEKRLNKDASRRLKGSIVAFSLIAATWSLFYCLQQALKPYATAAFLIDSLFIFFGLAGHSLIREAILVERKLSRVGLEAGRKQLSFIVGRETSLLNHNQIRTAVLETLAENLSDGVIAPLFFYLIGGVPLMFAYKMVNTLDSMIGYKNERYRDFGWFAAKTDDFFNYLPSRITAWLMIIISFRPSVLLFVIKYGRNHASPNSGYPESALAGILSCRFGGPNRYHGVLVEKPYIGKNKRDILSRDLYIACLLNFVCSVVMLTIGLLIL